jgi:choline dehydrogenase-like flavoprotein
MVHTLTTWFAALLYLIGVTIASSEYAHIKHSTASLLASYDYIIAGGGTSGLTVADRLTAEFPDRTVLVVEYGQLVNSTDILMPAATVPNRNYAFQILSQPEPGLNNRSFTVTVGKIVGGCSAINAQMFDRGSKADYDAWSEVAGDEYANAGWNWDGLLPYFKQVPLSSHQKSTGGELTEQRAPLSRRLRKARWRNMTTHMTPKRHTVGMAASTQVTHHSNGLVKVRDPLIANIRCLPVSRSYAHRLERAWCPCAERRGWW